MLSQLNEVYNQSANLSRWYKKIRIDSFSEGSVLVDYFVELQNVSQQLNTLEIRRMFHEALRVVPAATAPPPPAVVPLVKDMSVESISSSNSSSNSSSSEDTDADVNTESAEEATPEETISRPSMMLLGKYVLDPVSTDFIGNNSCFMHKCRHVTNMNTGSFSPPQSFQSNSCLPSSKLNRIR